MPAMDAAEWAKPKKDCLTHSNAPARPFFFSLFHLLLSPARFHNSTSRDSPAHLLNTPSTSQVSSSWLCELHLIPCSLLSNLSQLRQLQPVNSTFQSAAFGPRLFNSSANAFLRCLRPFIHPSNLTLSAGRFSSCSRQPFSSIPRQQLGQIRTRIMSSSDDDMPLASKPKTNGVNGGKQAI